MTGRPAAEPLTSDVLEMSDLGAKAMTDMAAKWPTEAALGKMTL